MPQKSHWYLFFKCSYLPTVVFAFFSQTSSICCVKWNIKYSHPHKYYPRPTLLDFGDQLRKDATTFLLSSATIGALELLVHCIVSIDHSKVHRRSMITTATRQEQRGTMLLLRPTAARYSCHAKRPPNNDYNDFGGGGGDHQNALNLPSG